MITVNMTGKGVKVYPPHKHEFCEVMCYLNGVGHMYTERGNIEFEPGTVIIMPSGVIHGSVSENGFVNISLGGDFGALLSEVPSKPLRLLDRAGDGRALAKLIYKNRNGSRAYLNMLASALASYLGGIENAAHTDSATERIIEKISVNAFDPKFRTADALENSGYAADYMRRRFKAVTGESPHNFLERLRIDRACYLIEVFGGVLSLSEIAERCGFDDYIYFSKTFKKRVGVSPCAYRAARRV